MQRLLILISIGQFVFSPIFGQEKVDRFSLDSIQGVYIPKDLSDCFIQLDKILKDNVKNDLTGMSEKTFLMDSHFGLGLWIRNNWQLWNGSRLSKSFNELGVFHPDDISSVILQSYYRYLLKEDINLEEQIQQIKDYWLKAKKEKDSINVDFNKYGIGDTVSFNYLFGFTSHRQENDFRTGKCVAMGIITDKNEVLLELQVLIIKSCDNKGIISFDSEKAYPYYKPPNNNDNPRIKYLKSGEKDWFHYLNWIKK
jgi:Domain of unknown function (DUF6794)